MKKAILDGRGCYHRGWGLVRGISLSRISARSTLLHQDKHYVGLPVVADAYRRERKVPLPIGPQRSGRLYCDDSRASCLPPSVAGTAAEETK